MTRLGPWLCSNDNRNILLIFLINLLRTFSFLQYLHLRSDSFTIILCTMYVLFYYVTSYYHFMHHFWGTDSTHYLLADMGICKLYLQRTAWIVPLWIMLELNSYFTYDIQCILPQFGSATSSSSFAIWPLFNTECYKRLKATKSLR